MKYTIYKISNSINDKVYIGKTKRSLKERWWEHCKPSNVGCFLLKRALNKHDKKNFKIEEIDCADNPKLADEKERFWISFYKSSNPEYGYNRLEGGSGHPGVVSEETKKKISIATSGPNNAGFGKPKSQEFKDHLSRVMTGRKASEETKKKISEYFTGSNNPNFGKPKSDEWKAKASASQKKRTGNTGAAVRKSVIELTTGIVLDSIQEMAEAFGLHRLKITRSVKGIPCDCNGKIFAFVE